MPYEKLKDSDYTNLRYRYFQRTGCLITAGGSEDNCITPEGLDGYMIPPPLPTQSAEVPMQCETSEPELPPTAECENVEEIPEETTDEDLEVDRDIDRNIEHNLVGRKIKALYDNGWSIYFLSMIPHHTIVPPLEAQTPSVCYS